MLNKILKIGIFLLFISSYNSSLASNSNLSSFKAYTKKTLSEWKTPGIAIAIVKDGEVIYLDTFGVKRTGTLSFLNNESLFRIASVSKTMTSAMVMTLAHKKKVNLNDSLSNILPGIIPKQNLNIINLLSHTSGYPTRAFTKHIESEKSHKEILNSLPEIESTCEPGKCYAYQNFIYSLSGNVISNITKENYETSMKKYIFSPLNMHNTSSNFNSYITSDNKALPHIREKGKYKVSFEDLNSYYYKVAPAGGINSNITDMAKWLQAQMGSFPKILPKKILNKMHAPVIKTDEEISSDRSWNKRVKTAYYGLGWRIYNYAGYKLVYHGGFLNGFTSAVAFLPNSNVGIVILANSSSPVPRILMTKFIDTYLNLPAIDYSAIELKRLLDYERKLSSS